MTFAGLLRVVVGVVLCVAALPVLAAEYPAPKEGTRSPRTSASTPAR